MATLTERSPGVWLARVFLPPAGPNEKGRQVGKVFRGNKKVVKIAVATWETDLRGTSPSVIGATVADLLDLWRRAKERDWEATTARDYRSRAKAITQDLGRVRLVDLDPLRIDSWIADMRLRRVGEGAIRGRTSALRAAISWGISRRMLRSNAITEASPRLRTGRRESRPEPEQVVALLRAGAAEGPRAALALRLLAATGAREAEVVALQWEDLEGDRLYIGRQHHSIGAEGLVRSRTKNGRSREVVLDPGTVRAIEGWRDVVEREIGHAGEWMLSEPHATRPPSPRWLYDLFNRAAKSAGIATGREDGFVPHDLRHWAASTALRDGHDPASVAARLGHSAETLMRVYVQEVEEGQAGIARSLALRLDG